MCHARLLIVIVVAGLAAGCGDSAPQKHNSPEGVFKAFQDAVNDEDWKTAANCMTTESQAMMADGLVLAALFGTGGDAAKEKEVTQMLKGHGIDLDAEPPAGGPGNGKMPSPSDTVKDRPALIADLMAFVKKNADKKGGPDFRLQNLSNLKVDGDRATGTVEAQRGEEPIEFVRVDGSWLISMPGGRGPGPAGPGPGDFEPPPGGNTPNAPLDIPAEPKSDQSSTSDPGAKLGTLWVDDKPYTLNHVIAYRTKFFDDPCTAVLLTEKPLKAAELAELKQLLASEGKDSGFFAWTPSLKLLFDEAGKPVYAFVWADNNSISSNSDMEAQAQKREGRIVGRGVRKQDDSSNGPNYRFDVAFDVALLPAEGKAAETAGPTKDPSATDSITSTPVETVDNTEQPATQPTEPAPPTEVKPVAPKVAAEETPRAPDVAAEEPAREPATVAEATRLLDLRTFPMIEGGKSMFERRQVGLLAYTAPIGLSEAFEFQRKHLKELGWKELAEGGQSIETGTPIALFTQDGFLVSTSASEDSYLKKGQTRVTIQNHGNIPLSTLPVPAGAETNHASATQTSYVTTAPEAEMQQTVRKMLLEKGWKTYGKAGPILFFKRNAVELTAFVREIDNQPGTTYITYSTEVLSADLPVPDDAEDPRYTDAMGELRFQLAGNAVDKLSAFYNEELARQGFKPTTKPIGEKQVAVVFRNDAKDMVTLDMNVNKDLTYVLMHHYSAAEVAEMDRLHKEAIAKRAKLEDEARQLGENDLVGRDLEWIEKELARRKAMPKIAIPIPGLAKKVEQRNKQNLEITVALGSGKTVVEAMRKHFQAAGWREDEIELDDAEDGKVRLSKGEGSLSFEYKDWFGADEIDVSGKNIKLEQGRDVAEFASLGGVSRPEPPPTEMLAKAPVDIPIPADATKLDVRSGANVTFDVAADMKQLAAYFRTAMARHGWSYDASFSINIGDNHASLNFTKNRKPCGVSLTNIHGGDFISVTIAGGGMDWARLRGSRATADPTVAETLAAKPSAANAKPDVPARKAAAPLAKAKAAPQTTKRPANATPKRSR
jgi:hypothetical protein